MIRILGIAGIFTAAILIAIIDIPKFEFIENSGRHKVAFYAILIVFILVSVIQVWIRSA